MTHVAKLFGLKEVVNLLSKHESYAKMDAQVTLSLDSTQSVFSGLRRVSETICQEQVKK